MKFALLFLALALPAASALAQDLKHTDDTLAVVKQLVEDKKAILIDVRSEAEWKQGHLEGAVFLPVTRLREGMTREEVAKALPPEEIKNKILYCHCAVGVRALTAARIFQTMGGYEVRALKPGYAQLIEAGFEKAKEPEARPRPEVLGN